MYLKTYVKYFMVVSLSFISLGLSAQTSIPFIIENNSPYPDSELFVAIVGEDLTPQANHIWVDAANGNILPMSPSYNTVQGPVIGGNTGPGQNGLYADCFTRLSDIPNNTFTLPPIQGCRVFISYGEQLYFYFFGSSGAQKGYTSPSYTNPTDPNNGILYEIIELTNDEIGFFGNTTRVDSYQYSIGMELFGNDGYYKKVGEIATPAEITSAFQASVPLEFQGCYDPATGEITAPAKTEAFADGSIGTMPNPGPYVNYMKPYVDAVWNKYANEDLVFDAGDAGIWRGRVQGEQLVMTSTSTAFEGRQAIIVRRPTTQEVFEGKGVLDNIVQDKTTDLLVQAQICAALNRHVIDVTTPNVGLQDWSNSAEYYQQSPCNHYAKFWHQQGISVDQLAYGFAYDDVFEYSSSVHTPNPNRVVVSFGPYTDGGGNDNDEDITGMGGNLSVQFTDSPAGEGFANLIDNDAATKYLTFNSSAWVQFQANNDYSLSSYSITSANDAPQRDPLNWNLQGSNDGVNWTALDVRSGVDFPSRQQKQTFQVAANSAFTYFRFNLTNNSGSILQLAEIELFGEGSSSGFSQTIQAENYSSMSGVQLENGAGAEAGQNVGYIDTNDWMAFNSINIPNSGNYTVSYRVASEGSGGELSLDVNGGANVLGYRTVPGTGGWYNWTTVSHTVYIEAGTYNFGIFAQTGGWNLDSWTISSASGASAQSAATAFNSENSMLEITEIGLSPNPAKSQLQIDFTAEHANLTLLNAHGRLMESTSNVSSGSLLSISHLKKGLYFLQVEIDGKVTVKRFIKE
ncbi:hypothetical protein GCM10011506_36400 [Marivirga lumbricoides]|uniref:Carbohydrate-binding protein n=3 Tax=Marivirga lumbricoides TaxID=1046115 RepID=A0ABQ1MV52_9BACT|nr:hypothetical protein GCM10011506_36400 [Marivirga lumbricoides]